MTAPLTADVEQMVERLRGQDAIPNRNEVADMLSALATQLAERESELARVTTERDALRAAKWDVQHTDTMNDFVLLGIDRDEKETALTAANRRIAALTEALEGCVAAIEHADMADGVCCCGDMMEGHSDPMSCGHSPVDQGHYHSHQVLASARAAITTDKEPTP